MMRRYSILLLCVQMMCSSQAQEENSKHLSLKLEVKRAIKLGTNYLMKQRNAKGSWSDDEHPALSALVVTALERAPSAKRVWTDKERQQSIDWLLSKQKEDGGIYTEGLATYNPIRCSSASISSSDARSCL